MAVDDRHFYGRIRYGMVTIPTHSVIIPFLDRPDAQMGWVLWSLQSSNFPGHSIGIGMYFIEHLDFGWQVFSGTGVDVGAYTIPFNGTSATTMTVSIRICAIRFSHSISHEYLLQITIND